MEKTKIICLDNTIDEDFAMKRMAEQLLYIEGVIRNKALTDSRKLELINSARGQLHYFEKKMADIVANERNRKSSAGRFKHK